jgi:hypothetical protein
MELSLLEDKTSPDYLDLKHAFDYYLAIADTIHVPMVVSQFANRDLRTPKHTEEHLTNNNNSISFDALQQQQREYEKLRTQHKVLYSFYIS